MADLVATPMISNDTTVMPWSEMLDHFDRGGTYWLSTVDARRHPHAVPLLAVIAQGRIHFVVGHATRKARNLAANPQCALTVNDDAFDLMVEGRATRVDGEPTLRCVADAYAQKYGWPVTVRDGAFHDTEGAPTAGPPPYLVHALSPTTAFALGPKDDGMNRATRWQFMNAR